MLIFFVLFFHIFVSSGYCQQTYHDTLTDYYSKYATYLEKKQKNSKYNTIETQQEEFLSAQEAFLARNLALESYLKTLQTLLDNYKALNITDTSILQSDLETYQRFLSTQNQTVSQINNTPDLNAQASLYKDNFTKINTLISLCLSRYRLNKQLAIIQNISSLGQQLQSMSSQHQSTILDVLSQIDQVTTKHQSIEKQLTQYSQSFSNTNIYQKLKYDLNLADKYLMDTSTNLYSIAHKIYANP